MKGRLGRNSQTANTGSVLCEIDCLPYMYTRRVTRWSRFGFSFSSSRPAVVGEPSGDRSNGRTFVEVSRHLRLINLAHERVRLLSLFQLTPARVETSSRPATCQPVPRRQPPAERSCRRRRKTALFLFFSCKTIVAPLPCLIGPRLLARG